MKKIYLFKLVFVSLAALRTPPVTCVIIGSKIFRMPNKKLIVFLGDAHIPHQETDNQFDNFCDLVNIFKSFPTTHPVKIAVEDCLNWLPKNPGLYYQKISAIIQNPSSSDIKNPVKHLLSTVIDNKSRLSPHYIPVDPRLAYDLFSKQAINETCFDKMILDLKLSKGAQNRVLYFKQATADTENSNHDKQKREQKHFNNLIKATDNLVEREIKNVITENPNSDIIVIAGAAHINTVLKKIFKEELWSDEEYQKLYANKKLMDYPVEDLKKLNATVAYNVCNRATKQSLYDTVFGPKGVSSGNSIFRNFFQKDLKKKVDVPNGLWTGNKLFISKYIND